MEGLLKRVVVAEEALKSMWRGGRGKRSTRGGLLRKQKAVRARRSEGRDVFVSLVTQHHYSYRGARVVIKAQAHIWQPSFTGQALELRLFSTSTIMLHRDLPFGLARNRGHAEPFFDGQPSTLRKPNPKTSRAQACNVSPGRLDAHETLPEDVIVIIMGFLTVAELMVVRRVSIQQLSFIQHLISDFKCGKWFKYLTENRQLWINFVSHPYFPTPASTPFDTLSNHALELLVRRQFELSRTWSPKKSTASCISTRRSYRLSMPNNESLTAMASMDGWVAVASDLGGVYVCAPFGLGFERGVKWIRMLSVPVEINKLFQCGLVTASVEELVAAQSRTQGRIVLSTSDFILSSTMQLRNLASEIMDIALGDRHCAIVDAAHVIQVFMHRTSGGERVDAPDRYEFQGEYRSSRKTISLQFLPNDQLLFQSDSFIAIYKPVSPDSSVISTRFLTRLPSTHYFGLLAQRRSSAARSLSNYTSVPLLALSESGAEVTHFDIRLPSDAENTGADDYGFSYRRSVSYLLAPWMKPFSLGAINGGHSRLVWITSAEGQPFGIALGRLCAGNSDPLQQYEAPLNPAELDLGEYRKALLEHAPSGPLFAFHEGEGKLLGGVRGTPDLFMMEY
ncbi:hypothetical protein FRC10_008136 [Ceratobasidium sp. 414]|nr:hypothetical protein FRC10_008136 [Ceratobasidium sp. 414]